jgi:hypothetical protein
VLYLAAILDYKRILKIEKRRWFLALTWAIIWVSAIVLFFATCYLDTSRIAWMRASCYQMYITCHEHVLAGATLAAPSQHIYLDRKKSWVRHFHGLLVNRRLILGIGDSYTDYQKTGSITMECIKIVWQMWTGARTAIFCWTWLPQVIVWIWWGVMVIIYTQSKLLPLLGNQ